MSLLSPDLRLAMAPHWLGVRAGGIRREAELAPGADPLAALAGLLAGLPRQGRARVVLSHELARVWLLPGPPVHLNRAETGSWLADELARRFGDQAHAWQLAWQPTPPGRPVLVAALDTARLDGLRVAMAGYGIRLASVEPWLAAAANRLNGRLGAGPAWLALAEPARITLARLERGRFLAVRSGRVADDPTVALADMVARESLRHDFAVAAPVWLAGASIAADWRTAAGLDIRPAAGADLAEA